MGVDRATEALSTARAELERGRHAEALEALDGASASAEVSNLRGRALLGLGRRAEARESFREACRLDPEDPRPHSNLALLLRDDGAHDEAIALLERALSLSGPNPRTLTNLANTLSIAQRPLEAERAYLEALQLQRTRPALLGLARLLARSGRWTEATPLFIEQLCSGPLQPELLTELARAADHAGGLEQASEVLVARAATLASVAEARQLALFATNAALWRLARAAAARGRALDPDDVDCTLLAARAAVAEGEEHAAEAMLAEACRGGAAPSVWLEWAMVAGRSRDGWMERVLDEALAAHPTSATLLAARASTDSRRGALRDGEARCLEALRYEPHNAHALNTLACIKLDLRRHEEALALYARVVALQPLRASHHSNLALVNHYVDATPEALYAVHDRFQDKFGWARPVVRRAEELDPGRRLRLGYLSADLREHSVARFLLPLLRGHDRERFELHAFSTSERHDAVSEEIRGLVEHWHDVSRMNDSAIARLVAELRIDVLVDLGGHTANNRLRVFAARPAPISLTYLGYPDTTGLRCIDHRLTDAIADPVGEADRLASEQLLRLAPTAWCFEPGVDVPIVPAPAGPTVFACFNAMHKVGEATLRTWARILARLPDAKLWIKAMALSEAEAREALLRDCELHGLDRSRVVVLEPTPTREAHLALLGQAHVALDAFPYDGTTTTCDALWMGLPVVSLRGRVHAGRVSASLLAALGLADCVAEDLDGYVERAVELAEDRARRDRLRAELRARFSASPLGDARRFVPAYEASLRALWVKYVEDRLSERVPRPDERRVSLGSGLGLFVDADVTRSPGFQLAEHGGWPEPEVDAVASILRPGEHVLDLGVGVGDRALRWARAVGDSGAVQAVDADPITLDRLRRSARASGLSQLAVEQATRAAWSPGARRSPPSWVRVSIAWHPRVEELRRLWPDAVLLIELPEEQAARRETHARASRFGPCRRWLPSLGVLARVEAADLDDHGCSSLFLLPEARASWSEPLVALDVDGSSSDETRAGGAEPRARELARPSERLRDALRPPIDAGTRLAMLRALVRSPGAAASAAPSVELRLVLARASFELGRPGTAARAIAPLVEQARELEAPAQMVPLLERYAELGDGSTPGWLEAQLLEAWLLWSSPSRSVRAKDELPALLRLFELGFDTPALARRLGLIATREGLLR